MKDSPNKNTAVDCITEQKAEGAALGQRVTRAEEKTGTNNAAEG